MQINNLLARTITTVKYDLINIYKYVTVDKISLWEFLSILTYGLQKLKRKMPQMLGRKHTDKTELEEEKQGWRSKNKRLYWCHAADAKDMKIFGFCCLTEPD